MIEKNDDTLRSVAWSELFPWLSLTRLFWLAVSLRGLVLGAAGMLVTALGWWLLATLFCSDIRELEPTDTSRPTIWLQPYAESPWRAVVKMAYDPAALSTKSDAAAKQPTPPAKAGGAAPGETKTEKTSTPGNLFDAAKTSGACWWNVPVAYPWYVLTMPALSSVSRTGFGVRDAACLIFCGLWGALVWSFFGTALCRTAAVRLAADEQIGWGSALRFAGKKWPSCFIAPLMPIAAVLVATLPVLVLGWFLKFNTGLLLGILWPLALVAGVFMAVLLLGALFGWPLMWGAICTEGTDSFDALSRSYTYLFQRPLRYLFYAAVAALFGWLGWLLVLWFSEGVIELSYWAAGWGCGAAQIESIRTAEGLEGVGGFGAWLIRAFAHCVRLLAAGYLFSYFWTAATAIYLLLRRDVDAAEMDEVFLDADATEPQESPAAVAGDATAPAVANAEQL
jgi:hypothetical protein